MKREQDYKERKMATKKTIKQIVEKHNAAVRATIADTLGKVVELDPTLDMAKLWKVKSCTEASALLSALLLVAGYKPEAEMTDAEMVAAADSIENLHERM